VKNLMWSYQMPGQEPVYALFKEKGDQFGTKRMFLYRQSQDVEKYNRKLIGKR